MKATIDGIACEGTPEEIIEFKKLRDALNEDEVWERLKKDNPFTIIPKKSDIHTDSVTVPNQPYIWQGKGSPYDAKFDKTNESSSRQGIDTINPDIKCETENK